MEIPQINIHITLFFSHGKMKIYNNPTTDLKNNKLYVNTLIHLCASDSLLNGDIVVRYKFVIIIIMILLIELLQTTSS